MDRIGRKPFGARFFGAEWFENYLEFLVDYISMGNWHLRIIESAQELEKVESLQRVVWSGSETDIVPVHLLITAVHNGGLVIGAYQQSEDGEGPALIGFVFGFAGFHFTPGGLRLKHVSHMLAVHPDHRDGGLGFALKRAQWQMVRHQGVDLISWTYDPLLSRNGHLNISKLGAVCNCYRRELYGEMSDGLNVGLPSDRFEVNWWVNTKRVGRRLSRRSRQQLDLAHYFAAGVEIINPTTAGDDGWPLPGKIMLLQNRDQPQGRQGKSSILLFEIPSDFQTMRMIKPGLAYDWRMHSRTLFERLFRRGYLVTDFVRLEGSHPRSFYVLSHGESTL